MENLLLSLSDCAVSALDAALRAQFGAGISGLSYDGSAVRVHFLSAPSGADQTAAQAIVDAHDPVFFSASRAGDTVTVQVSKPRNLDSASQVTLTVNGTPLPSPTALTANQGTALIVSADPVTIGVETYPHEEVEA